MVSNRAMFHKNESQIRCCYSATALNEVILNYKNEVEKKDLKYGQVTVTIGRAISALF